MSLFFRQRLIPGLVSIGLLLMCAATHAEKSIEKDTLDPYTLDIPTPALTLPDVNGVSHQLSDYRGQTIILNFWATWCPPCRAEMPSFQRASEIVADQGIVVLGVNVGDDAETVKAFLKSVQVAFTNLLDTGAEASQYWPMLGLPTTFIINGDGEIIFTALGPREWDSEKILNLIRELPGKPER